MITIFGKFVGINHTVIAFIPVQNDTRSVIVKRSNFDVG